MRDLLTGRASLFFAAVLAAASLAPLRGANAAGLEPETVLYSFCARSSGGKNCVDGQDPYAALLMDASGRLYGTTNEGGTHNLGTVFELVVRCQQTIPVC